MQDGGDGIHGGDGKATRSGPAIRDAYGGDLLDGDFPRSRFRSREGPAFSRPSSPAWSTTSVRVSRSGKDRFERFRLRVSREGRVLPHWEAFERLLDEAGAW